MGLWWLRRQDKQGLSEFSLLTRSVYLMFSDSAASVQHFTQPDQSEETALQLRTGWRRFDDSPRQREASCLFPLQPWIDLMEEPLARCTEMSGSIPAEVNTAHL